MPQLPLGVIEVKLTHSMWSLGLDLPTDSLSTHTHSLSPLAILSSYSAPCITYLDTPILIMPPFSTAEIYFFTHVNATEDAYEPD